MNILNNEQIKKYSKKLTHYLNGVKKRQKLSSEEIASKLGISESHYRKFESNGYNDSGRFISAIEFLYRLSQLENMNLYQFFCYFDNPKKIPIGKIKDTHLERDPFPWEIKMLEEFNTIDMDTRTEFINVISSNSKNPNILSQLIKISILIDDLILSKMTPEQIKLFDLLLEYIYSISKNEYLTRILIAKNSIKKFFGQV